MKRFYLMMLVLVASILGGARIIAQDIISLREVPFYHWDGWGADAQPIEMVGCEWVVGESTSMPYGDPSIINYADLSQYSKLIITYTDGIPRVLMNRDVDQGQFSATESESHLIEYPKCASTWASKYFTDQDGVLTIDLKQMVADKGFAHLHSIKGANWVNVTVTSMELEEGEGDSPVTNSGDLIYTIDYSKLSDYPFYRMDAPEGSSFDVIDGVLQIENTVEQGGAWSLQPIIADLMSLQEGNDYIVRLTYKSTVSASVNFNMGTWGASMSKSDIQLEASDEFQTLEVMFAKSTVDATENNAHIIIQCGSYVGTLQISKVEVFEIAKAVTDDNPGGDDPDDTLTPLTTDMFHVWDNYIATSHIAVEDGGCEYHLNETVSPGNVIYGNVSVDYLHYADLTGYQSLNIEGTPDMVLRLLLNRTDVESSFIELNPTIGADGKATVDIAEYEFFHLNAIKLSWSSPSGIITSLTLTGKGKTDDNPGNDNPVVEGPALSIVGTTFKKGQENILPVSMQGAEDIISYQFDVAFPEGVKVSNITLNDRYARTHAISYNELDNQNVRIAVSASIPFSTSAGGRMPLSDVPFYQWDGWDAAATPIDPMYFAYVLGESTVLPYGDGNILGYADLSNYSKLKVTVTEGTPRFLFNRDVQEGQWSDNESESHLIDSSKGGWSSRYFSYEETENGTVYTVDLAWIKKDKGFAHLHAIKGANWTDVLVTDMEVEEASDDVLMNISVEVAETMDAGNYTVAVSNIEISNNTGETLKSADKNFTVSVVDNETEIADATLYISPVTTLMKGQENYIPVSLQSTQDVVACQFDLVLPENFDYKNIALSEANSETHNISYNWLDDGSIRFVIASLDNETFSRTGTSLFTLDLYIKDYLADGDYTIAVKNMMFTTEDYSTLTSADKDFVVMVADPIMMGDVNNDRKVDVTDVVLIIDEILGKYPNNFKAEAADVNGDGYINVTDVVLVIDNILGKVTLNRAPVADGELGSVALSSFNGDNSTVGVSLTNPTAYTAFQMDVTLPMGVSLEKAQLTGRGTDSHHLSISQIGEGRYRIVGVSMDNETLNGNSGNLLNMTLKSNTQAFGAIALDNVIFVTPNGTQHELDSVVSYGDATGIADVRMSDNKAEIYDLQGRRVNTLKKGLYINNGKKTVMK